MSPSRVAAITTLRGDLIEIVTEAALASPEDAVLFGQATRLLVDQREPQRALALLDRCRASVWWCLKLQAYVHASSDQLISADSLFQRADSLMPLSDRCRWNDNAVLLDPTVREVYRGLSCVQRDSANDVLWWLADPLMSEPGNQRRAIQHARRTVLELRLQIAADERYNWSASMVREARMEMILRYGWPSYVFWAGEDEEAEHASMLRVNRSHPSVAEVHTGFEYLPGRMRMIPSSQAVISPFESTINDWQLNSPAGGDRPTQVEPLWWPTEHYESPYPIVSLPEGQLAMLRRDSTILLASAVRLDPVALGRALGTHVEASLVVSSQPTREPSTSSAPAIVGNVVRLRQFVASSPAIVGIEVAPDRELRRTAGRSRFGVMPPPTLAQSRQSAIAVSDPVLIEVGDQDAVPADPDRVLARMLGSTHVTSGKFGVYWETYGVSPGDSVEVSVWIGRQSDESVLRRFTTSLRITQDLNTPVAISWVEPQPGQQVHHIPGILPILARSVVLDVSGLPRGDYVLEVAVRKVGATEVARGKRELTIG